MLNESNSSKKGNRSNIESALKYSLSLEKIFREFGELKFCEKDSFLFMEGDSPEFAFLVEEGLLKICQLTDTGQEITFYIRKPKDAFALAEIVLDHNHFCFAQCLQDCHIWFLDAAIVHQIMEKDIAVLKDILYLMTSRLIYQQSTVESLNTQSVPERLAWFFKEVSMGNQQEFTVELDLTHEEISNIVGCSRQTITQTLNKWRREGRIKYFRKKFQIINLEGV